MNAGKPQECKPADMSYLLHRPHIFVRFGWGLCSSTSYSVYLTVYTVCPFGLAGVVRVERTHDRVKAGYVPDSSHAFMEHDIGLEPTKPAWRAGVLPLHQSCAGRLDITYTSPGTEGHTFELCNYVYVSAKFKEKGV